MPTILAHGDGDGICSASIVKMVKQYANADVFFTHPMGFAKDLLGIDDDVVVVDIAIDQRAYNEIYDLMEEISQKHEFIYIDHHKLPGPLPKTVKVVSSEKACATELAFRFFFNYLPKFASHFACIGAICDYMDKTPVITELINEYERRSLYLDAGILSQGLNGYRRNYDDIRLMVDRFSRGIYPCEMKKLVKKAIAASKEDKIHREVILKEYQIRKNIAWIINPKASKTKSAHWIMADSAKVIGLAIFTYNSKRNLADISIRGRGLVDLRTIVPKLAQEMGGSGGGHANALGCRIPLPKLQKFLEILDDTLDALEIKNPLRVEEIIDINKIF